MQISKPLVCLLLGAALLQGGRTAQAANIYKPYYDCMGKCSAELSICLDNIRGKTEEQDSQSEQCNSTNAACVQECQYLPVPGDTSAPPLTEPEPKPESQPHQESQAHQDVQVTDSVSQPQ